MRIGLLASTGGMLDSFFPEIAAVWEAEGHTVLTAAGSPAERLPGALIGGLTRRPALSAPRARRELRAWCADAGCDVVVTNSATASALVRMSRLPVPVVYFCHGLHWNGVRTPQDRVWQTVEHQLLARTAAVITLNSDDEAWFRQRMPQHTVERIRAGVGLDLRSYPRAPLPEGPLRLAWIGEHTARKRPHLALDAAAELHGAGVDFELTMIGAGQRLERTRRDVHVRGLSDAVRVAGWGDARPVLREAHALLHTAQWEGLPRVMLEAFAVGRRSYAFDVKGVRDAPGAVLVPDGDAAALARAVREDWGSGRMRTPLTENPGFLCSTGVARRILAFLRGTVLPAGTAAAAGTATPAGTVQSPGTASFAGTAARTGSAASAGTAAHAVPSPGTDPPPGAGRVAV
jgi:glycosyltransferase involved in cell wall biosynthesis